MSTIRIQDLPQCCICDKHDYCNVSRLANETFDFCNVHQIEFTGHCKKYIEDYRKKLQASKPRIV